MNNMFSLSEVAKYLRVSVYQVRLLIRNGQIIASNVGVGENGRKYLRIKKEDLLQFLQDREVK